jgi:hypothetical protein
VSLVQNVLRIVESKSEEGERTIALSPILVDALAHHYRRTAYKGDGDLVFCHPERGTRISDKWFADELRAAFGEARMAQVMERPDVNGAAAGEQPIALMARAGHSSMATTKGYLHLAGVVFRDEADALERRLLTSA